MKKYIKETEDTYINRYAYKDSYTIDVVNIISIDRVCNNDDNLAAIFWLCKSADKKLFILSSIYIIENYEDECMIDTLLSFINRNIIDKANSDIILTSNIPIYYSNFDFYTSDYREFKKITMPVLDDLNNTLNLFINKTNILRSFGYIDSLMMGKNKVIKHDLFEYVLMKNSLEDTINTYIVSDINNIESIIYTDYDDKNVLYNIFTYNINEHRKDFIIGSTFSSLDFSDGGKKFTRKQLKKLESMYKQIMESEEINYCYLFFEIKINDKKYLAIDTLTNKNEERLFILDHNDTDGTVSKLIQKICDFEDMIKDGEI